MFLLDTNVVSELRKVRSGKGDANVTEWAIAIPAASMFVSVIVIQDLESGILQVERRDPAKAGVLRRWLENHVLPAFAGRVLAVDLAVARRAAALNVPDARPAMDGLIAATALVHGLTIATRNEARFRPTGVAVVNPWA